MRNFEIHTANGQYNADRVESAFKELSTAIALRAIVPLSHCQLLLLAMLESSYDEFLAKAREGEQQ